MDAFLAEKETLLGDIVAAIDVAEEAGVNDDTEAAIEAAIRAYSDRCQALWSQLMGGEVVLNDGLEVSVWGRGLPVRTFCSSGGSRQRRKHPITYICSFDCALLVGRK